MRNTRSAALNVHFLRQYLCVHVVWFTCCILNRVSKVLTLTSSRCIFFERLWWQLECGDQPVKGENQQQSLCLESLGMQSMWKALLENQTST